MHKIRRDFPLFIYGTLMRGGEAERHMEGARFLGEAVTALPAFDLLAVEWQDCPEDLPRYFPGMVGTVKTQNSWHIKGELYDGITPRASRAA